MPDTSEQDPKELTAEQIIQELSQMHPDSLFGVLPQLEDLVEKIKNSTKEETEGAAASGPAP
eukprot:CAMPEP_0181320016 /NCGR_PEP_ID=MMETSP1101-20121128/17890_1 /TAXON_ID=46948 /ORGANISM="Rhodomonas abbreviata, Strain Caron Lab Isolate" /LENGTH=61 /DNA_ID=CAMNT_0023427675 /DNA_START=16 /DNA_END=201 /DNA_ORIENTATION=-